MSLKARKADTPHTCSCRNQFTDDDVLFQTDQRVNLTFDSSLSQNLLLSPGRMLLTGRNWLPGMPW